MSTPQEHVLKDAGGGGGDAGGDAGNPGGLSQAELKFLDDLGAKGAPPRLAPNGSEPTPKQKQEADAGGTETPEAKATREEQEKAKREQDRKDAIERLGLVPLEALQEARSESKKARDDAAALRAEFNRFQEQLRTTAKPAAGQEDPEPDPAKDPQGWRDWAFRALAREVQTGKQFREEQARMAKQQEDLGRLNSWASTQVSEFKKREPSYDEAYAFARQSRAKDYEALGYAPDQIQAQLVQDEIGLAISAAQQNKNPGEVLYAWALSRGFQKKAPAPAGKPAKDPTAEALEKIAAGTKAAGGLNGGGESRGSEMTPEEIAAMPIRTKAQRDAAAAAWKKLTGSSR